jgi:hypothetical protein
MGQLGDVAQDMRELADQMHQGHITDRMMERQRQILSRLLDAQKSIRSQGQRKQRKAEAPRGDAAGVDPGALPEGIDDQETTLGRDVLRGHEGDYPPQYEPMVRSYFRELSGSGGGSPALPGASPDATPAPTDGDDADGGGDALDSGTDGSR